MCLLPIYYYTDMEPFCYTPSRGEFKYKNILWNEYTQPEILKKVECFHFLSSDIVINTFPRSGTTLSQEIVWHIMNKDVIRKDAKYGDIDQRFPFLEYNSKFDAPESTPAVDRLECMVTDKYRLIKTHCPLEFIKPNLYKSKPKCIVVFRNPRDVCLSLFHFYRGMKLFGPWTGSWEEFHKMFEKGATKCGSWLKWHTDWWSELQIHEITDCPSVTVSKGGLATLFYTFEKMIKNPEIVITSIANFLGESLTKEQIEIILYNTNFRQMSQDSNLNVKDNVTGFTFIRKGQIGGWKEQFSNDQLESFEDVVESNLANLGMIFDYGN